MILAPWIINLKKKKLNIKIKTFLNICVVAVVEKKETPYLKYLKLIGSINFKQNLYLSCYGLD